MSKKREKAVGLGAGGSWRSWRDEEDGWDELGGGCATRLSLDWGSFWAWEVDGTLEWRSRVGFGVDAMGGCRG